MHKNSPKVILKFLPVDADTFETVYYVVLLLNLSVSLWARLCYSGLAVVYLISLTYILPFYPAYVSLTFVSVNVRVCSQKCQTSTSSTKTRSKSARSDKILQNMCNSTSKCINIRYFEIRKSNILFSGEGGTVPSPASLPSGDTPFPLCLRHFYPGVFGARPPDLPPPLQSISTHCKIPGV